MISLFSSCRGFLMHVVSLVLILCSLYDALPFDDVVLLSRGK